MYYTIIYINKDLYTELKLYTNMEPDITNIKLLITINLCGIFLFTKLDLFINSNDLEKI
jgi:hypothetical protein